MGGVSGGRQDLVGKDIKINPLVVHDVKVVTQEYTVEVPKYVEKIVEVPKFIAKDIVVTHVKVVEETVTTQNVVVKDKVIEVERPVYKDVEIERPVYKTIEVQDVVIKKVEKVVEIEVPRYIEKLHIIKKEQEVIVPKLVEEIIKVPKIRYVPTEVERIVWKDVPRERCKHCSKEID